MPKPCPHRCESVTIMAAGRIRQTLHATGNVSAALDAQHVNGGHHVPAVFVGGHRFAFRLVVLRFVVLLFVLRKDHPASLRVTV